MLEPIISDMYDVLLAIDRNNARARGQAEAISKLPRDPDDILVRLLHSFTNNPDGASVGQIGAVQDAKNALATQNISVSLSERSGDPATEILSEAREEEVDAICIGGRKRTPAGKALFGSVAQKVILDADRPVFITPTGT